jgi:hypothetical protein
VQAGDLYTLTEDGVPDKVLSVSRQPAPGWNTAEVLKVNDDSTLLVAYLANAAEPPNVTVEVANVRPAPPAPPAGWAANVRQGELCDVYEDEAWWEATVERIVRPGGVDKKVAKAKVKLSCRPADEPPTEVRLAQLRPRYTWQGWANGWLYACEGRTLPAQPGPMPPRAHNLPSTEDAPVAETTRGRTVVKPKAFRDGSGAAAGAGGAGGPVGLSRSSSMVPIYDEARVPKLGELLEVEVQGLPLIAFDCL